jgi:hypothetical protein
MREPASRRESPSLLQPQEPLDQARHLLRVVASVNGDAQHVWTQLWNEIKPQVSPAGAPLPALQQGFVPPCGWNEFLERMWLLKHYLDSVHRICHESK